MQRTRIKICGITRIEDALAAAECGADAIGMVFHPPAPRNISLELARQILHALPPFVTPVGLFVDAATDHILQATQSLGLRHVQLHGHEKPQQLAELHRLRVIKAVRVDRATIVGEMNLWREAIASLKLGHLAGFVLETAGTGAAGGTGIENDWSAIRAARESGVFDNLPPIIAAGGLRAETVGQVIRSIRPWAVDVSSGVELVRGQKSREKIKSFIAEAHRADAQV